LHSRRARQVSVQATQRTLSEHAPDREAYAAKYAQLKGHNVRELDRFLMIAAKVLTGALRGRCRALRLHAPRRCARAPGVSDATRCASGGGLRRTAQRCAVRPRFAFESACVVRAALRFAR
jgi:hypothetical protein